MLLLGDDRMTFERRRTSHRSRCLLITYMRKMQMFMVFFTPTTTA